MLILKQNAANTVPTPPAGKGTIFLDDSDTLSVKTSDGNVQTFPTVGAANAQVLFMNGTNITGESALTYDYNNNVLTVSGNVAATRVLTDNLLYANGTAWDLQQPGGSNTQIQFNDNDQFGGSAAFTFNKTSNTITASGNIGANNFNATTYVTAGNVYANSGIIGAQNLKGEGGNISNIQGANVSGAVGSATTAGTVTTAAQPNITSVGALTALDMGGHIIPTANATYDLGNSTNLFRDLYLSGQSIKLGGATIAANATAVTITNPVGGTMTVSGTGAASTSSIYNGNSNVSVAANSNVTVSVSGNSNIITVTGTGVNVAGTLNTGSGVITGNGSGLSSLAGGNVTGQVGNALVAGTVYTNAQPNITSVGTLSSLAVTGNVTAGNVYANSGTIGASLLTGTLTTASQPNVTSVGTLGSLTVTGKVTAGQLQGDGGNISNIQGANVSGAVGSATTAGTVTTAAQPNITSVGTLSSLAVTGNANVGNLGTGGLIVATGNVTGGNLTTAGVVSATGNVTGGNLTTGGALSVTGNANVGNIGATQGVFTNVSGNGSALSSITGGNVTGQVANALVAGTVYTNAQPNITSVGTLSSLTVTGNANVGNINPTNLVATGSGSFGANLNMNTNYINNLGTPVLSSDAATKQYVDDLASTALTYHTGVTAATTDTLANTTGGTMTYTQPGGAGNGIGAYLSTTGTFNLIDTANVQTAGTRILVKNEANATWNGVYQYTNATAITRTTDADEYGPNSASQLSLNDYFFVSGGNVNKGSAYVVDSPSGTITFGTSNITFAQFSSSQVYSNGVGLNLSGTTFSLANTSVTDASYGNGDRVASFTVDAQGRLTAASNTVIAANAGNLIGTTLNSSIVTSSLTTVGTLGTLSVTGNANVGNIGATQGVFTNVSGNGSALSSITGGNVTGQVGNALVSGTVYTAAQPNITSVGTLTSVAVTGNANVGNLNAATAVIASTLTSNVATGTAPLTVTSTTRVANLNVATAGIANTVNDAAQPNITSVGTLSSLAVTGNVTAGNANVTGQLISTVATGTAPLVVTSTTQVANLSVATAGSATTAGTVTTAAQPNITSVGTLTSLGVSGTITAANITANTGVFTGNANGLSSIQGANVTGTLNSTTLGNSTLYVGTTSIALNRGSASQSLTGITSIDGYAATVSGAAQANITSVGTLTSLNSSGNITAPNLIANTGFVISSVNAAVSAAGTAQGNATVLTREINVTSTVASGAGVALPTAVAGMRVTIINTAANAVLVYPASGGTINSLALNAAFSQVAGGKLDYVATSTTQWYTLNATYA